MLLFMFRNSTVLIFIASAVGWEEIWGLGLLIRKAATRKTTNKEATPEHLMQTHTSL